MKPCEMVDAMGASIANGGSGDEEFAVLMAQYSEKSIEELLDFIMLGCEE